VEPNEQHRDRGPDAADHDDAGQERIASGARVIGVPLEEPVKAPEDDGPGYGRQKERYTVNDKLADDATIRGSIFSHLKAGIRPQIAAGRRPAITISRRGAGRTVTSALERAAGFCAKKNPARGLGRNAPGNWEQCQISSALFKTGCNRERSGRTYERSSATGGKLGPAASPIAMG
jgi:hypothetical protein